MNLFYESVLWIYELGFDLLLIYLVNTYEARTRHQRCRTHVRHGDAQGTPLLARPAALCHVDSTCFLPTRADVSRRGFDSGRLGPETANIGRNSKKKKKGVERTVWLLSKPYFSPVSHKCQNISSHLSSHFVSHFTCLCLSASISSPLWLWDTQPLGTHSVCCFNSFFLHLSLTHS